jgi:hypothetical protein
MISVVKAQSGKASREPMFTYSAFITELRPLTERARNLSDRSNRVEDEDFRRWRHEVTDLISRIEARKYRINCQIVYRNFDELGSYTYTPSRGERLAAYKRDLIDTITELETLISHFDKYGDPRAEPAPPPVRGASVPAVPTEPPKLQPPERVTPAWLWQHGTVTLWIQGLGLLGIAFVAGVGVGKSALYAELSTKVDSPAATASSPLSPASSSAKR